MEDTEKERCIWIVVLDDEPALREGILRMLARADFGRPLVIQDAPDGTAGAELICSRASEGRWPDLVITDNQMPGRMGQDLVGEFCSRCPFILASGNFTQEILERVEARGARCLPKPYRASEVIELARELLNG